MPWSWTPVVTGWLTLSPPGLLPSANAIASAFPGFRQFILRPQKYGISGLNLTAYVLAPPSFTRPLLALHVGLATDLLVRL